MYRRSLNAVYLNLWFVWIKFLWCIENASRLPKNYHCKKTDCPSHSNLRPQGSTSGLRACCPRQAEQWWCFLMPSRGLHRKSWRVWGGNLLRCLVLLCWGCLLSEEYAENPLSPRQPGPAHRRVNITLEYSLMRFTYIKVQTDGDVSIPEMMFTGQSWWLDFSLGRANIHPSEKQWLPWHLWVMLTFLRICLKQQSIWLFKNAFWISIWHFSPPWAKAYPNKSFI